MSQTTTKKKKKTSVLDDLKNLFGTKSLTDEQMLEEQQKKLAKATEKDRKEKEKLAKKQRKVDELQHKQNLKGTEAEAHYLRLEKQAGEAADQLFGLRGAVTQLKLIEQGRQTARELAAKKDFVQAKAVLEKLDAPGLCQRGLEAEEQADARLQERFPAVIKLGEDIKISLPRFPIPKDDVDRLIGDVDRLVAPLKGQGVDDDIVDTIEERLGFLQEHVDHLRNEGEIFRKRYLDARQAADPVVKRLAGLAGDRDIAPLVKNLEMAKTHAQTKDFSHAAELAEAVAADAQEVYDTALNAMREWDDKEQDVSPLIETAKDLADNDSPVLVGRQPAAKDILARLTTLQEYLDTDKETKKKAAADKKPIDPTTMMVGSKVSYAEAIKITQEAEGQLGALQALLDSADQMKDVRDNALSEIADGMQAVRDSLIAMRAAIEKTMGKKNAKQSDGVFGDQLEAIRVAWEASSARAATPEELDAKATADKLIKLKQDIDQVTSDPAAHFTVFRDQLFDVARQKFDEADELFAEALARLLIVSAVDAARQQGARDKCVTAVGKADRPAAIDAETTKLTAITAKVEEVAGLIEQNIDKQRQAAEKLLAEVKTEVDGLGADIEKVREDQKHNPAKNDAAAYTPQFEALRDQYEQLDSVVPVGDMGGLNDAIADLGILLSGVKAARAALKGGRDSEGHSIITLASLGKDLATLRGKLDRKDFRSYIAVTQAKLITKADDLKDGLPTMLIPAASLKLEELQEAYEAAKLDLEKAKSGFEEFQKSVSQGRKMLKEQKDAFTSAPDAYAAFDSRIQGCESAAKVEGELETARKKMLDILVELQDVVKDPQKIATSQTEANEARKKAEQNAARFKGQHESFLERLAGYTEISSKDRKDLEKLAAGAKKVFDTSADYDTAMVQLQAAAQRAELLHKFPEGASTAARNNLPKVIARWKTAVTAFNDDLKALAGKITEIEDKDEYTAAKASADKMIKQLLPLFSPIAFDTAAGKITAKGAADNVRAAGREEGLRMVRRYNAYIDKDYRFMELSGNPFVPGLKADIVAVHLALLDVERNLLISV